MDLAVSTLDLRDVGKAGCSRIVSAHPLFHSTPSVTQTRGRWNRARPTLCIKDPHKARKMRAIGQALGKADSEHPVFYVDEADVDLNPRIGHAWMLKGKQTAIPTPVKIKNVIWRAHSILSVAEEKKNSFLFIRLLAALQ